MSKGDQESLGPTTRLIDGDSNTLSLLKRITILTVGVLNIFAQYLYFTAPLSFLANEIIEKRGLSATIAGGVFGALCLSLCATLVLAPKTSAILSIRQAMFLSIVLSLLSTVFYIRQMHNTAWVVYTFISRILQGIAIGLTDVRFLDMMTLAFPKRISLVTCSYEIAFSASLMVGPELGGYLYESQGYWAPLNIATLSTVVMCIFAIICSYSLDYDNPEDNAEDSAESQSGIFHYPIMVLGFTVMFSVSISVTIVESFLSNYLRRKYDLTESATGWAMTVAGMFYTIATFVSGVVGSKHSNLKYALVGGLILSATSCLLLSQDYGYLAKLKYYWPAAMYCVMEIGSGLTQVAVLPLIVEHYKNIVPGIAENTASCHMGGLYTSTFFLGSFVGPILGGVILNISSFEVCSLVAGVILLLETVFLLVLNVKNRSLMDPWRMNTLQTL